MKLAKGGSSQAWQPLTPPGVAAFATASGGRLALVQLLFAVLAGVVVTSFLVSAWFPTIAGATRNLPEEGYIRGERLVWTGDRTAVLANSLWLAITVDVQQGEGYRLPSDVQVEFSENSVRFLSLTGCLDVRYPSGWIIVFNKSELGAWWNAWAPFLAAGAGLLTTVGWQLVWTCLGWIYAIPATAICRFLELDVSWRAVWKICVAAQLPGALLMSFTLLLYSLRAVDLVTWLFVVVAQAPLSWVYLTLAVFFLPGKTAAGTPRCNPFTPP